MFIQFFKYLRFSNRYCGVEHIIDPNGTNITYATLIKKQKKELKIEEQFCVNSIHELKKKLPKNQHISLVINDENVITKETKSQSDEDQLTTVNNTFPNVDLKDFYYNIISNDNKCFIALCRKHIVDELIDQYHKLGLFPIQVSLGVTSITNILPFLKESNLKTSQHLLKVENNSLVAISSTRESNEVFYDVNGLNSSGNYLQSLASTLGTILNSKNSKFNYKDFESYLLLKFLRQQFYNRFLKIGLFFMLIMLLINFLFFNHYFQETGILEQSMVVNQNTREKVMFLRDDVAIKKKMVDDVLKNNSSKSSYQVNSLIQAIPEVIILSKLSFQPLLKGVKDNKPIEVNESMITIEGISNDGGEFSRWITRLEEILWVEDVLIKEYSEENEHSSFEIEINTNDI